MSVWIDRKYLASISHRLEQYKAKNHDLYNFRCPFCGDSKKNRHKARAFVYMKRNDYFFMCHNCGKSTTFPKLLEFVDPVTYKEYTLERYFNCEGNNRQPKKLTIPQDYHSDVFDKMQSIVTNKKQNDLTISKICDLPETHYAREYITNRKIPHQFLSEIFFTENFKKFMDTEFPKHGKEDIPEDDRIVMLYTNAKGDITHVAGRALSNTKMRYLTVKIIDEKKIFGTHRMSLDKKIYVVEGQFDSFFLPNAVASGDSNLGGIAQTFPDADITLVYDAEPRNKDLVRQIKKSVDSGYNVCLLPAVETGKDINDMVCNGVSQEDLMSMIESHTYSGLRAQLELNMWKKC